MKTCHQLTREERVQVARSWVPNVAVAKNRFHRHTLKRRLRGVGPQESRIGPGRKLEDTQEAAIISYCARLGLMNTSARLVQIKGAANLLLVRTHGDLTNTPAVGENWTRRFLTRHPELHKFK